MHRPLPAVGTNDSDPPLRGGRAGPFAQSVILAQAFSFLGGLVYLTPLVEPDSPGYLEPGPGSWADESSVVGDGWLGSFVERWDAATTAWVSIGFIVLLCFLATRVTRSRAWAAAAGVSLLALAALWIVLAVDVGGGAFSESGFAATMIVVCTSSLVAGACACFLVASHQRSGIAQSSGRPTFALGIARARARALDIVLLSFPFGPRSC